MRRNSLLILILAAAAGVVVLWIQGGAPLRLAADPSIEPQAGAPAQSPEHELQLAEAAPEAVLREARPVTRGADGPRALRLRMVDAATQAPVPDVRAYVGEEVLGGPSDAQGWLEFTPPPGRRTTFWAPGWSPREFHSRAMPTDHVELRAATASLEVLIDQLAPEEGVLLCRLEPMDWTSTSGTAWSAQLQIAAPHRLLGERLAGGRYQIYTWIGAYQDQGIALEPVEVELEPGKRTLVRLDASVRPDAEVDD